MIVLEKYRVTVANDQLTDSFEGFPFFIGKIRAMSDCFDVSNLQYFSTEFEDGLNQRLGATTEQERDDWVQALRMAGYDLMRAQLQYLREQIEKRRGSHRLDVDVDMHRLQSGNQILGEQFHDNVDDLIRF